MSEPNSYTVGWICAISTEYVAAQAFLDEEHEGPEHLSPNDNNDYTLGRMGKHNVVIAVLPSGEYGVSRAAGVASDMMHSFPNVRIGLMVGIGGGAPSPKHDIRLGDIVVSDPRDGNGGVLQYDFGKTIQSQTFQRTGLLNQPPTVLRAAVNGLKAQYESKGHRLEESINGSLRKKPRLLKKYSRPNLNSDRLYQSRVVHPVNDDVSCVASCGTGRKRLVLRSERTQDHDNLTIHYGVIASGNQLMKDASVRDKLAAEEDILCFEMEAAGLMNHFPCLVIRGICDYSDSHKNEEWQGYAAMAAAAYAKDLLRRITPNRVETEKKIGDILYGLREVTQNQRDIAKKQLEAQTSFAKERLSEKEEKCHQLFRLTTGSRDATYEWYKDRVEERVKDTCFWFLKHEHFQKWMKQDSGPLLVTADPGCGKSVLAKYLIDQYLPRPTTICYFFFKDQDQNTVRQALCALLHQLFAQKPFLIGHAMTQFRTDGQGLINSTDSLWKVLRNAIHDPKAGPVILVLDALDECAELEFADLMRNVESQFRSDKWGHGKLKYLLTCRPYEQIVSKFRGLLEVFPNMRIPGEEESEIINQEVNRVITHRVNQLLERKNLSPQMKSHLEKRLQETTHRTYLWVYLVFDYLERENFKKTLKGIESAIATLPMSINEAYEQILSKSKEHPMVRKALSIILVASRPLTLSEMNIAVNIDDKTRCFQDIDLEEDEDFKLRLRSWCGLFISIHRGKIYFLHQTAREFLLADLVWPATIPLQAQWHRSINIYCAHAVVAELCIRYLNFFNYDLGLPKDANREAGNSTDSHAFLEYSAKFWGAHFREAGIVDNVPIIHSALGICDPGSKSYSVWFKIYWKTTGMKTTEPFTNLMVASYCGHPGVVKLLLGKGGDIEPRDTEYGRTPLFWAAENGYEAVVKLLLEHGACIEAKSNRHQTPLSRAAEKGHDTIVKLLLEKGAEIETKSISGQTPLLLAAKSGRAAIVKLLLESGAEVESKDVNGQTPLFWAIANGREAVVRLLLEKGAEVEAENDSGQTPLLVAAGNGHEAIVRLLLDGGAEVEAKNKDNLAPLFWAAANGHEAVVRLLLEKGACVEAKSNRHQTPLSRAAEKGHGTIVKLLLEKGAEVETKSNSGRTPLSRAAEKGHEAIVKLLLENGADANAENRDNLTPLSWAAANGHKPIVKLLLENGAKVEVKSNSGRTPLSRAAASGHVAVVKLLLEKGADIEAQKRDTLTPLWAGERGHKGIVKLLLENGADVNAENGDFLTPLSWAAANGHEVIVKLLLENGADIEAKNRDNLTPLSWASEKGHGAVVKLLIEKGAEVKARSKSGRTPLSRAAEKGHEAIAKLLLENGADIEAGSNSGQTPLLLAAEKGHEAIVKLLQRKS
ncbi:ankyrin repeat-containing protein [Pochonia chlamydosporia 170]|uniref:Ankyrin repeat-containing protein n=1 Tax=Pochonia chlamydosporia 170 TaxID=1380566 RepID=A0A219AP18_METCM|nr:ankyrin repeat-containing protein [Pochonia chlamydosporia 170]OWT42590.1 ankyrin repeat-containing protein [Pochonia chlamydosporia 170]